jgi:hypothetical protein
MKGTVLKLMKRRKGILTSIVKKAMSSRMVLRSRLIDIGIDLSKTP